MSDNHRRVRNFNMDELKDLSDIVSSDGGRSAAEEAARAVDELPPVKAPRYISPFSTGKRRNSHRSSRDHSSSSASGGGCGCLLFIILLAIFFEGC